MCINIWSVRRTHNNEKIYVHKCCAQVRLPQKWNMHGQGQSRLFVRAALKVKNKLINKIIMNL
jgi:hypothetical protein